MGTEPLPFPVKVTEPPRPCYDASMSDAFFFTVIGILAAGMIALALRAGPRGSAPVRPIRSVIATAAEMRPPRRTKQGRRSSRARFEPLSGNERWRR